MTWEKLSQTAIRLNGELIQTDSFMVCNRMVEILQQYDRLASELEQLRVAILKVTTQATLDHMRNHP